MLKTGGLIDHFAEAARHIITHKRAAHQRQFLKTFIGKTGNHRFRQARPAFGYIKTAIAGQSGQQSSSKPNIGASPLVEIYFTRLTLSLAISVSDVPQACNHKHNGQAEPGHGILQMIIGHGKRVCPPRGQASLARPPRPIRR